MKRSPLKRRTALRTTNPKRQGSRFPHRRDRAYTRWLRSLPCLLASRTTTVKLAPYDLRDGDVWQHVCWGPIDSAHVNKTRASGAGDVGEVVPLCRAAHRALDQRLGAAEFAQVTALDLGRIARELPDWYTKDEPAF